MNVKNTILNSLDTRGLDRDKTTIVCTSNERYVPVLTACLNSIEHNSDDVNVVARLVNVEDTTYEQIVSSYNDVRFIRDQIDASVRRDVVTDNASHIGWKRLIKKVRNKKSRVGLHEFHSQESAYCSNIKFNTMNMLINDEFKCVVYLDADTLVMNDISHINEMMSGYDIGMYIHEAEIGKYKTYHQQEYSGWHAGFMVATNTPSCKKLYNEIEDRVNSNIYDIEADEDEFEAAYKINQSELKLKLFDKQYKDCGPEFSTESYMWTGQAEIKSCNEQYIKQYRQYKSIK